MAKKKPKKNRSKNKSRNIKFNSTAPSPIKMKYFEGSFSDHTDQTQQERLAILKSTGRKAAEEFPIKYKSISDWLQRYDQPKLLAFSYYYFMMAPAGYDEEAVTGNLEFPLIIKNYYRHSH